MNESRTVVLWYAKTFSQVARVSRVAVSFEGTLRVVSAADASLLAPRPFVSLV